MPALIEAPEDPEVDPPDPELGPFGRRLAYVLVPFVALWTLGRALLEVALPALGRGAWRLIRGVAELVRFVLANTIGRVLDMVWWALRPPLRLIRAIAVGVALRVRLVARGVG